MVAAVVNGCSTDRQSHSHSQPPSPSPSPSQRAAIRSSTLSFMATSANCIVLFVVLILTAASSVDAAVDFNSPKFDSASFLYPRVAAAFPTRSLSHVEPILAYSVRHADNAHLHNPSTLHPMSTHPMKVGHAANSIGAHALKWRKRGPLPQPFPDRIESIRFRAYDKEFHLTNLHLDTKLWSPDAVVQVRQSDGSVKTIRPHLNTYQARMSRANGDSMDGHAIVTLSADGTMSGVIHTETETYQLDPLSVHLADMDDVRAKEMLRRYTPHSMVMFRQSDLKQPAAGFQCGAVRPPKRTDTYTPHSINASDIKLTSLGSEAVSAASRRLLADPPPPGTGISLWTNCYTGDTRAHKLSVGVAVDRGFYALYGSSEMSVLNAISTVYANVNAVYLAQMNMFLELVDTQIEATTSSLAWNLAPPTNGERCSTTIDDLLDAFTDWRMKSKKNQDGLWHLLTNCYPAPGTVGLAWIGMMCADYGAAVSSWTSSLWLTVAHETGHNFGAQHTFQEGEGMTGGIMDYGDGTLNGVYQFNTKYSKSQMCAEIQSVTSNSAISPYCLADYAPTCGNGVVERGEQCDDDTTCCDKCQFAVGATCTPAHGNECCDSTTCKSKPSTMMCGNNVGYCANGVCHNAICTEYGLPFCGLESSGCRQKCGGGSSGEPCTSGWSQPDTRMADGTVCKTSTYSQCSNGNCVATTPPTTYTWVIDDWSACSCGTGEGTQTRSVVCTSSSGAAVADSNCQVEKPASQQSCPASSVCNTWSPSAWSSCNVDCGSGVETRTVQCIGGSGTASEGQVLPDSQCPQPKPATQQTCQVGTVCPTEWKLGEWGACTESCYDGERIGVQSRSVQCMQTQNGVMSEVSADHCPAPVPTNVQECNTDWCQDGQWVYGTWSSCNVTCGGEGVSTRSEQCVANGGPVNPARCATAVRGATTRECNTNPCPNYVWHAQDWTNCTASCGGSGQQTRTVRCYDDANDPSLATPLNENYCISTKPPTFRLCNTEACPLPPDYRWKTGIWSSCTVSCGGGSTTRTVSCYDANTGVTQSDSTCLSSSTAGAKPATMQACAEQGCPTYEWSMSAWSGCSVACGGGEQTRSVACRDSVTSLIVADSKCSGTKPTSSQSCSTQQCTTAYVWKQGEGSACTQACGGGLQTFKPACWRTDTSPQMQVDDSACADQAKPATIGSCNTHSCPTYWWSGAWSPCTRACDSGFQNRTVHCFYATDDPLTATPLSDSYCTSSKPDSSASCNNIPCPQWVAQSWPTCSERCGVGLQTRNLTCQYYDGSTAPDAECAHSPVPTTQQSCSLMPCPHWHVGVYGECSKPCADTVGAGVQHRTVECRMPSDDPRYMGILVDDESLCNYSMATADGAAIYPQLYTKPLSTATCNTDACSSYYWLAKPGECSVSCGGIGTRTSTIVCMSSETGQQVESNLCLAVKPPTLTSCNTFECPKYEYALGAWSDCNIFCGSGGNQTRTVQCRNSNPGPDLSSSYDVVDVDLSYCASTAPIPSSVRECSAPEDVCWGRYDVTGRKDGRCVDSSRCECRSGFTGKQCQTAVAIQNVQINGLTLFSGAGVPFDQPLHIQWDSNTTLVPRVSILLMRAGDPTWPTGQYLAVDIINTNSWIWSLGTVLKQGLEAGDGYSIRVLQNYKSFDDSPEFSIADPCAYTSCGRNGQCVRGICQCVTGYSGEHCSIGPCQAALCSTEHSACNNSDVILSGKSSSSDVCACTDGWSGSQCRTPPSCTSAPACQHGGDLSGAVLDGSCSASQCVCTGNWAGSTCETCSLQCRNGGQADSQCTQCACNPGHFGKLCECKYYALTFRYDVNVSAWWNALDGELARARWQRTLELELSSAASTAAGMKVELSVMNAKPFNDGSKAYVDVTLRLSLRCSSVVMDRSAYGVRSGMDAVETYQPVHGPRLSHATAAPFHLASASKPSTAARRHLLATVSASDESALLSVYAAILPLLSNRDSSMYRGEVSHEADASFAVTATDPSGQQRLTQPVAPTDCYDNACPTYSSPSEPPPDDGDENQSLLDKVLGNTTYLAVACVIIALILIFIIAVCVTCFRRCGSSGSSSGLDRAISRMTSGAEMTSPVPGANTMQTGRWDRA